MFKRRQFFQYIFITFLALSLNSQAQWKSHEIGHLWLSMFPVGSRPDYAPLADLMTFPAGGKQIVIIILTRLAAGNIAKLGVKNIAHIRIKFKSQPFGRDQPR